MQRWHLTLGLGVAALAAALVAPQLRARVATPPPHNPEPPVAPPLPEPPKAVEAPQGSLTVEMGLDRTALLAGASDERFLAVTVRAPADLGDGERRKVGISVVLDTSGSMLARGKIDHARAAAKHLAANLEAGDQFALVTFADDATTVIPLGAVHNKDAVDATIDRLPVRGGTNLFAGLERGQSELQRGLASGAIGRVILLSDGQATAGITDPASLKRLTAQLSGQGITVSTIGLGAEFNEDLLADMADIGGGTYAFVDHPRVLSTVFGEELRRSASVVARGVNVEVALPPGVEVLETLGWTATPTSAGVSVNLGEIYAGDQRKIVMRVRTRAPVSDGTWAIGTATASYDDLIQSRPATSSATASVTLTNRAEVAKVAVDKARAAQAAEALGNLLLDQSTREYQKGDSLRAKALATRSQEVFEQAAVDYDAPALAAQAAPAAKAAASYDAVAPSTEAGQNLIKATKGEARTNARR